MENSSPYKLPAALFVTGLISLLGQVILLRELNVAFFGVELIYMLALGMWLLLAALGAMISRRILPPSLNRLALLFAAFGICILLSVAFIRGSRLLFSGVPGAYLSFPRQLTAMVMALLPIGLLSGLLFQWAAKLYVRENRTLIAAYGIESAGGLAGGFLATAFIMLGVQNFAIAVSCGMVAVALAAVLLPTGGPFFHRGALAGVACLMIIATFFSTGVDRRMTSWNHPGLLDSRDSPYGRITASMLQGQITVFENDAIAFETQGTEAESFAHLAALQHPGPESILILGGGIEGTVREILRHAPKRVDYVELNPVMMEVVSRQLPADIGASLKNPSVHVTVGDPSSFLRQSGRYDLILIGMPEPSSGQSNRFYTKEFFTLCAERLNPWGVVGLRLRSAENFWTPQLARRTASIYRALTAVFHDVLFLPGTVNVVTASLEPLPRSPDTLIERFRERKIAARLVSPPYIRYLLTNDRVPEIERLLRSSSVPPNTDVRPVCYPYAIMIWLSKFFPGMALPDLSAYAEGVAAGLWPWAAATALLLLFFLFRFRLSWRNTLLAGAAGFLGMVLEAVLILHYQVKQGVLFQDIGFLLTLFMAGLALGALAADRMMRAGGEARRGARWVGGGYLAAFMLLFLLVGLVVTSGRFSSLAPTAALLGGTGFLVAGLFGYASIRDARGREEAVSPLYAADLVGGCLGSLLGSLVLIPLLGLDTTVKWMAILAALSLLLL